MDKLLLTPAALLNFLLEVDELKDLEISLLTDDSDAQSIMISIGESTYTLMPSDNEAAVAVDADDIDEVSYTEEEAITEMGASSGTNQEMVNIESGILKEIAKTLMIGGMVRLTTNLLKK